LVIALMNLNRNDDDGDDDTGAVFTAFAAAATPTILTLPVALPSSPVMTATCA
jgi:hypothetical protein